jgi:hypothetical protein
VRPWQQAAAAEAIYKPSYQLNGNTFFRQRKTTGTEGYFENGVI